jgi:3-deoxy-D-manno-octulosonic-acid transferase
MSKQPLQKSAFALYNFGWQIAIPWLKKHHRLAEGYRQRALHGQPPRKADLWIQAASAGESYLALEIIKALPPSPPLRVLLTSNTRQGIDILKQALPETCGEQGQIQSTVRYFPFDKPAIMNRAVDNIRPKVMVLLEAEIWPGLLSALKGYACKIVIVNGRLTEKSLKRYLLWHAFWQSLSPDRILAISKTDASRFALLFGDEGVDVMPNIKFDRIQQTDSVGQIDNPIADLLPNSAPFVVLGSIRRMEEPLIVKIVRHILDQNSAAVVGLFPRHMDRIAHWEQQLKRLSIPYTLRSRIKTSIDHGTVLLWDTFGELGMAYGLSSAAFVGGSLAPLGGQNFLEALTCGVIPVIGPFWENFHWIGREILEQGLVRVAKDWQVVAYLLLRDMENPTSRKEVRQNTLTYVKNRQGGTKMACSHISALLNRR